MDCSQKHGMGAIKEEMLDGFKFAIKTGGPIPFQFLFAKLSLVRITPLLKN
jgi:hypothetical protein